MPKLIKRSQKVFFSLEREYFLVQILLKGCISSPKFLSNEYMYIFIHTNKYLSPKCHPPPPPWENTRCTYWRQHKANFGPHLFDKTENFKGFKGFLQILHLNEGSGTPLLLLKYLVLNKHACHIASE